MNQDIYYFAGKRYCLSAVVGLGLGGPEARQKRGAPWWRHHNQPTV